MNLTIKTFMDAKAMLEADNPHEEPKPLVLRQSQAKHIFGSDEIVMEPRLLPAEFFGLNGFTHYVVGPDKIEAMGAQ